MPEAGQEPGRILLIRTCAAATLAVAGLAWVGWLADWPRLAALGSSGIPMAPRTAFCLALTAAVLWAQVARPARLPRAWTVAALGVVTAACLWSLFLRWGDSSALWAALSQHAPVQGGFPKWKMAGTTALLLALLCIPFMACEWGWRSWGRAAAWSGAAVGLSAFTLTLAYACRTPLLYREGLIPVALPTAASLLFLAAGISALHGAQHAPASWLAGPSLRARLLRGLLPATLTSALLQGLLEHGLGGSLNPALEHILVAGPVILIWLGVMGLAIHRAAREFDQALQTAKEHEARFRSVSEGQQVLNEMLRISLTPGALSGKLQLLLDQIFGADWMRIMPKGAIFLRDGGELVLAAQRGLAEPLLESCARVPLGRCLCGRAAQQGETVVASHVDERHEVSYEGMTPHGHICAPISAKGSVLGVLNLYLADGVVPKARQLEAVKAYTDLIANMLLLHKAEEQLQQSLKMEAVGRLAGGVAHDFNNMLTAIKGYAEFLTMSLGKDDPQREDACEILKAADRAAALTSQLLAFSRRQVLSPVVLDLDEAVLGVSKMLKRLLGEDVRLVCESAGTLDAVRADRGQIEQVIMNLCLNARDAMPDGGTLTIRTRNCELGAERLGELSDLPPGPYVELSVTDTGEGMTPDVKARIFEPFFTTKEKGKGTGLGLSMVYGIVKQSGGGIAVESSPGKGSTFRILLPIVSPEAAAAEEQAAPSKESFAGSEAILLVEDEAPVLALTRRALEQRGYTVLAAEEGAAALGLLNGHDGEIRLLLTDVVMSGMNGRELSDRVQALRPGIKTLFISGYTDDVIARHGILESGVELLSKPFTPEELARRVRQVLDS